MRNHNINGYPSFAPQQKTGFFARHMRRLSSNLPRFAGSSGPYGHKGKQVRGPWYGPNGSLAQRIRSVFGRMGRKFKIRLLIAAIVLFCVIVFFNSRMCPWSLCGPFFPFSLGLTIPSLQLC